MSYFKLVSLATSLLFLIGFTRSQQQGLNGFPQPKAIREDSRYFHTETYFPGGLSANTFPQASTQKLAPIQANPNLVPITSSFARHPIIASFPEEPDDEELIVRSIPNRLRIENQKIRQTSTTSRPITTTEALTSDEIEEQAKSAYYKFGSSVRDTINDHEHVREEVREGLAVTGMYSYSDGFFRRTVHYIADEDGYRVTKEEILPIGDGQGPKFNPKGEANVKSSLAGNYAITVDDFKLTKKQQKEIEDQSV